MSYQNINRIRNTSAANSRTDVNSVSSSIDSFNESDQSLISNVDDIENTAGLTNEIHSNDQNVHSQINRRGYSIQDQNYKFTRNATANSFINRSVFIFKKVFIKGPDHPSDPIYKCDHFPWLAKIDFFPFQLRKRVPAKISALALILYVFLWFSIIVSLLSKNLYDAPRVINGAPDTEIIQLSCREHPDFWAGKNAQCGLNADGCLRDFKIFNSKKNGKKSSGSLAGSFSAVSNKDIIIKCPALCDSESKIYSTITTGLDTHKYISYVVGGGLIDSASTSHLVDKEQITNPYRADSFPCAAALHAGLISPMFGGCARLSFSSSNDKTILKFESKVGKYIGKSVEFDSIFPFSYIFKKLATPKDASSSSSSSSSSSGSEPVVTVTNCYDHRMIITGLNILFGIPVMYLYTGLINYLIVSFVAFWTIVLTLDPPIILDSLNPEASSYLISVGFRRFLPLSFVLYTLWKFVVSKTLNKNASPLGKIFLWYLFFWVSAMNNLTFDKYLQVDRFIITDMKSSVESLITLVIVISITAICIVIQAFSVWKTGKLLKYLSFYGITFFALFLFSMLPGLTLRIHHYIFGMILIPGTGTRGFSALLFQGLLLGFVINGIARWDFASIVETDGTLRRDDPFGSVDLRPPQFDSFNPQVNSLSWSPVVSSSSSIESASSTLANRTFDTEAYYDDIEGRQLNGYSLLINDIERYRGGNTTVSVTDLLSTNKVFGNFLNTAVTEAGKSSSSTKQAAPRIGDSNNSGNDIKLYLRLARASINKDKVGDYTNAAVLWWPSGNFESPKPGVT